MVARNNQSLLDIALQKYGSVEGLADLAFRNDKSITDLLTVGEELAVGLPINVDVVSFYKERKHIISTGAEEYSPISRIISLSPTSLNFGNVEIGETVTRTFTITNTGTDALTITGITLPSFASYTASWTIGTIPAGGSQVVTITYAPSVAGAQNGNIVVNSNATGGTNTVAVTATATDTSGNALFGDATNDYFSVAKGTTTNYTVSFWLKILSSNGNFKCVIGSRNYSSGFSGDGIVLYEISGNLQLWIKDVGFSSLFSTPSVPLNALVHITIVKNGLNFRLFKNGLLSNSGNVAGTFSDTSPQWVFGDIPLHGLLSRLGYAFFDFIEFNFALTDLQVSDLHAGIIPAGTVQRLKFESLYKTGANVFTPALIGTDAQIFGYATGAKGIVDNNNNDIQLVP
jgi:hypothetical protein